MSQMGPQTFGEIAAAFLTIAGAPPTRLFQIFIDPVMSAQPLPL